MSDSILATKFCIFSSEVLLRAEHAHRDYNTTKLLEDCLHNSSRQGTPPTRCKCIRPSRTNRRWLRDLTSCVHVLRSHINFLLQSMLKRRVLRSRYVPAVNAVLPSSAVRHWSMEAKFAAAMELESRVVMRQSHRTSREVTSDIRTPS
jgi:hypothetical protein